jgi:hypothetical protein
MLAQSETDELHVVDPLYTMTSSSPEIEIAFVPEVRPVFVKFPFAPKPPLAIADKNAEGVVWFVPVNA